MICINKGNIKNLTIGKNYIITKTNSGTHRSSSISYYNVWVINDANIEKHYSSKRFINISEYRENRLNEILS